MNAFRRLSQNLKTLNIVEMIQSLMQENEALLLSLQKDQLNAGLDGEGNSFRLKYSQDPYFKSPEAGRRYGAWKHSMNKGTNTLFPVRDVDTPNLRINGNLFHNLINISVTRGSLIINADSPIIVDLERKYGQALLGLSPIALTYYVEEILFVRLQKKVNQWLNQ